MNKNAVIHEYVADRNYVRAAANHAAQPPDAAFAEQRARL
jgi:hypothetical protein